MGLPTDRRTWREAEYSRAVAVIVQFFSQHEEQFTELRGVSGILEFHAIQVMASKLHPCDDLPGVVERDDGGGGGSGAPVVIVAAE